ncbi:hypothetical protein RRG08_024534 [Elysia crispata]|uniref:Cholesterol side-chain cleavage enzyme, mitochondrial n=1 Tax=Elysia crispata TaxID=231223 RepID=A0AAE1CU31_9GAST|nr:hypothetical protein RRG08_024534 [Elysia crispata]
MILKKYHRNYISLSLLFRQRRRHREFGKIFREQFGPRQNVVIADPDLMAEVLRKEGKYPSRPPYESWVLYNQLRRKDGGLMTSEREYWKKSRGVLATKLRPRAVADYVPIMNEVCSDFLARIEMLKVPAQGGPAKDSNPHTDSNSENPDEEASSHMDAPHTVPRMLNELNKFSMETILYVMLNTRVGCLEAKLSEQVDSFVRSIARMFLTGHQLMVYANIHKLLSTRPWREHVQSMDKIYEFASHHVNQCIDEVTRELESTTCSTGEEPVSFLKYVVGTNQLSRDQIVDNVIETFMAGIDTTANALAFLFYLLSKNESVQERLVTEVDNVVGGRTPSSEDLQRMPFLKACVKETLRLFPPIPINARSTTEDCSLGGYHIPKDTILMLNLYVMSRDEKVFPNPDEFHPERWLREGRDENEPLPHPFSLLPFGSGVRSCVGRRVAEIQMYLATIQVLQRYTLKKSDVFDIKPFVRTQLTPGPELPVMFLER